MPSTLSRGWALGIRASSQWPWPDPGQVGAGPGPLYLEIVRVRVTDKDYDVLYSFVCIRDTCNNKSQKHQVVFSVRNLEIKY